jgi:hypothetical protein
MAFKFFRRRQKSVVIIMVALMVSFLLGFKGLSMLLNRSSGNPERGRLSDGRVLRAKDFSLAAFDMDLLTRITTAGDPVFRYITGNQNQRVGTYGLLLAEAQAGGPATEIDIDDYLGAYLRATVDSDDEEAYRNLMATVRSHDIAPSLFREAVGRMLQVRSTFKQSLLRTPPSLPRIRRLFADLTEKITIRVAIVPAENYLGSCGEPTADEIDAQFQEFREAIRGELGSADQFAFGYRMPRRVSVEYMILDAHRIRRAVVPGDADARDYYIEHKDDSDFLAELGIDEETAAELSTPLPRFSEVRQAISAKLAVEDVQTKMRSCLTTIDKHMEDYRKAVAGGDVAEVDPYGYVVQQLTSPADDLLARPVAAIAVDGKPLDEAMAMLAKAADLKAIVFPSSESVEAMVVQLNLSNTTLGEALAQVSGQLGIASPLWVQLSSETGLGDVLFAAGDDGSLPVVIGNTPLLDRPGITRHGRLARAVTRSADPVSLVAMAFRDELFRGDSENVLMEQARMVLVEGRELRDELLWRITDLRDEEVLTEMTDEIRLQVVRDCKIVRAMDLAKAAGEDLATKVRDGQPFVSVAAAAGHNTTETVPFTRSSPGYSRITRPTPINHVPMSRPVLEQFLDAVFAMPYAKRPVPMGDLEGVVRDLEAVEVLTFPRDETVFVVELLDHEPASGEDFFSRGQFEAMSLLAMEREELSARMWFDWENVIRRTGFERVEEDAPAEPNKEDTETE